MDQLLNHLDFWLMVVTIAAGVYYLVWKDRLEPLMQRLASFLQGASRTEHARERRARLRPRLVRGVHRPATSALPAGNSGATKLRLVTSDVAAPEREVTSQNEVAVTSNEVTISVSEAAIIASRLAQGMTPSAVAKSLPGYSPKKNYREYAAKVAQVKAALAEAEAAELTYQPLTEDGTA